MGNYFDKNGKTIDLITWGKLLEDWKYRIIKQDELPSRKWISTVWLGIDYSFGGKKPLIFETMVFPSHGKWNELGCDRYATLKQAICGHNKMVKKHIGSEQDYQLYKLKE